MCQFEEVAAIEGSAVSVCSALAMRKRRSAGLSVETIPTGPEISSTTDAPLQHGTTWAIWDEGCWERGEAV